MFTDFQADGFDYRRMAGNLSLIAMDPGFCCQVLGRGRGCDCPENFMVDWGLLERFLKVTVKSMIDENFGAIFRSCDAPDPQMKTAPILQESIKKTGLFHVENDYQVSWNLSMSVSMITSRDISPAKTAMIDKDGAHPIGNTTLPTIKKFLRIGTVESPPWAYYKRDQLNNIMRDHDGNPIWTGYCIEFTEQIARIMSFDYEFVVPKTGKFGERNKLGVWDGLIGDLVASETEIAVAPLKMTAAREEVIDFVSPYFEQTGILIAMRKPLKEASLFKFMTVLRLEVWMSILAALCVTGLFRVWYFILRY